MNKQLQLTDITESMGDTAAGSSEAFDWSLYWCHDNAITIWNVMLIKVSFSFLSDHLVVGDTCTKSSHHRLKWHITRRVSLYIECWSGHEIIFKSHIDPQMAQNVAYGSFHRYWAYTTRKINVLMCICLVCMLGALVCCGWCVLVL